jgi:hypothetical protein
LHRFGQSIDTEGLEASCLDRATLEQKLLEKKLEAARVTFEVMRLF